jgi:hypothetical protein
MMNAIFSIPSYFLSLKVEMLFSTTYYTED